MRRIYLAAPVHVSSQQAWVAWGLVIGLRFATPDGATCGGTEQQMNCDRSMPGLAAIPISTFSAGRCTTYAGPLGATLHSALHEEAA